jgi:hypothetical protein
MMKMAVVCNDASCGLVEIDGRFRGTYCLQYQADVSDDEILTALKTELQNGPVYSSNDMHFYVFSFRN